MGALFLDLDSFPVRRPRLPPPESRLCPNEEGLLGVEFHSDGRKPGRLLAAPNLRELAFPPHQEPLASSEAYDWPPREAKPSSL